MNARVASKPTVSFVPHAQFMNNLMRHSAPAAVLVALVLSGCSLDNAPDPTGAASVPQCSDAFVLSQVTGGEDSLGDPNDPATLALANPRAGFIPADALAGHTVLCAVTYDFRIQDSTLVSSVAIIDPGSDPVRSISEWAVANGYTDANDPEWSMPLDDNGMSTSKFQLFPYNYPGLDPSMFQEGSATLGFPLDPNDVYVNHGTWTHP